jgi:general secretion pathway protein G
MKPLALILSALMAASLLVIFLGRQGPHTPRQSPITVAMIQLYAFRVALDCYRGDNGSYPAGVQALVERPPGATNWHGPYLSTDFIPKDPWGHDYIYELPGRHNTNSYDLSSVGPPQAQTVLANWITGSLRP